MEKTHKLEEKKQNPKPTRGLSRRGGGNAHPFELRLKAVKLRLEEAYPTHLIAKEMGIGSTTLLEWVRCYRRWGEEGLRLCNINSHAHPKFSKNQRGGKYEQNIMCTVDF